MFTLALLACQPDQPPAPGADTAVVSTATTPSQTTPATLTRGGVIACEDPTERSALGPYAQADVGAEWAEQSPAGWTDPVELGGGLSIADFTGDGRLDIFLANISPCQLFVPDEDGIWNDETSERLPDLTGACEAAGTSAADVDGDVSTL